MRTLLTGTFLLLFGMGIVHAQTYSPDRPGIGNGSSITPERMLGVEAGIEFTDSEISNRLDIGQVLLRYGIIDKLELRAALNSYTRVNVETSFFSDSYSGFNDMDIGAKYNFISKTENHPSVSGMAELTLPVGSDRFSSGDISSTLTVLSDYDLNDMWSVSSNLGYWFNPEVANADYWTFTFTPSFTIPNNEDIAGYFGYAGLYYEGGSTNWLETGVTYTLAGNTQLDVNFGYESDAEVFFIGAGYAQGFN
ncbi:transporter [Gracilimonas mengyeensis]|uniref:MetA-pathway of phenol degradation n=1 Tax=Gracilimonas mengyeensis TaxID=1302730 RepID=A0A521EKI9_9BACT|nr:transporter [Gracilimonas mengyeensis]SMO83660.1 Putative MetA-pathway of phenol degradation [Gracilimonas mengyeensis]